jgi:hypothetical protein
MQLKPGMKGIIVKPVECCGSTKFIGALVEFISQGEGFITRCIHCGTDKRATKDHVQVRKSGINNWVMMESRIKWFNDDIDLEDTTEEVTKEIANAA